MRARLVVVTALIVAALLVVIVWKRINGQPVAIAVTTENVAPAQTDSLPVSLDTSTSISAPKNDERAVAVMPAAPQPNPSDAVESNGEPASDATLVVHCRAKPSGRPIEGVRVIVSTNDARFSSKYTTAPGTKGTLHQSPITRKSGDVEFAVPSEVDLEIRSKARWNDVGDVHQSVPKLERGEQRSIVLELPSPDDLEFHGIVVSSDGAKPIEAAAIQVMLGDHWSSPERTKDPAGGRDLLHTRGDGRFELTTSSWKESYLRVRAGGYGTVLVNVRPGHESEEHAHVITLERSASIEATVVDANGAPLGGVRVKASASGMSLKQRELTFETDDAASQDKVSWVATTSADGKCVLHDITSHVELEIALERDGKSLLEENDRIELQPSEIRRVRWKIGGGCTVTGVLLDETGTPVADHGVWLVHADENARRYLGSFDDVRSNTTAATNREGRFTFVDVRAGKWLVGPSPPEEGASLDGNALAPYASLIDVGPDAQQLDVVLKVQRGLYIRGRVLDGANVGVAGKWVAVDAGSVSESETKEDGSFVVGPLMPGDYRLVVGDELDASKSGPVSAKAGDDHVILRLRAGGRIAGIVLDAASRLPCRARVELVRTTPDFGLFGAQTNSDGSFAMQGLKEGTYDVIARVNDGRIGVQRGVVIAEGTKLEHVEVSVERGALLRIRYDGADESRGVSVRVDGVLVAADMFMRRGVPLEVSAPHGRATIELLSALAGNELTKTVDVAAGEVKEIVFGDGR